MPSSPILLLDVMLHGRFICQLRYTRRGFPRIIDGQMVEVYDQEDIERFVYEQRPSLRGKDIRIEFSDQKAQTRNFS